MASLALPLAMEIVCHDVQEVDIPVVVDERQGRDGGIVQFRDDVTDHKRRQEIRKKGEIRLRST